MKIRVINRRKFRRGIILLAILVLGFFYCMTNVSSSETIMNYKTITVNKGDTLWSIASYEQEQNGYYKDEDIRNIVLNIKKVNNLKSSNLNEKQTLKIPTKS